MKHVWTAALCIPIFLLFISSVFAQEPPDNSTPAPIFPSVFGVDVQYPQGNTVYDYFYDYVAIPQTWFSPLGSTPRYSIRFSPPQRVTYQVCQYAQVGGSQTVSYTRARQDFQVDILDLRTGTVLMRNTFIGATPEPCPSSFQSYGTGGIGLTRPDKAEFIAWMNEFAARVGLPNFPVELYLGGDDLIPPIYSPDGNYIALQEAYASVRVLNTRTGESGSEWIPDEPNASITSVEFSPDSTKLLITTRADDQPVLVYDVNSDRILLTLQLGDSSIFDSEAHYSADGHTVFVNSQNGNGQTLRAYDAESGEIIYQTRQEADERTDFGVSPNGEQLLMVGSDDSAYLVSAETGDPLFKLTTPVRVSGYDFSADGKTILTVDVQGLIEIWNTNDGSELFQIAAFDTPSLARFSPDGQTIIAADYYSSIHLFDSATGHLLRVLSDGTDIEEYTITYSPDGRLIAAADFNATVHIWDAATGQELLNLTGDYPQFAPVGATLLIGRDDGPEIAMPYVGIWDISHVARAMDMASSVSSSDCSGTVVSSSATINLRSGPGTDFAVRGTLPNGSDISLISRSGEWYQILSNEQEAWIWGQLLSLNEESCINLPQP